MKTKKDVLVNTTLNMAKATKDDRRPLRLATLRLEGKE